MNNKKLLGERLKAARKEAGLKQEDVGRVLGLGKSTISEWETGKRSPDIELITELATILDTSVAFLLGLEMEPDAQSMSSLPSNVQPVSELHMHRIPMIGEIAAGEPILCMQDYETFVPGPMGADFALTVRGDSMEPTYLTGDIVYLRQQDDVYDGQVAAVIIDDEATLKHVYHIPNGLTLVADNTAYPPRVVTLPEYDSIRILGLVIGYTRMYKRG